DTQFFPEEVVVGDRNMGLDYILDKENEFSYTNAGGDKNGTYCFKEISICGDLVKLEEVGNDLIEKGIVSKLPNLTPRWCINR
ncbi:MAG: hypothetical protein PHO80_04890, partial [Candidatus Gracilibacteria bacterium]|nr:hypothetical protein [Candidatus Gracilibacteria bacterium]